MSDDDYMKALEIQRRNFEAQFGSLETLGFEDKSRADAMSSSSDSDGAASGDSDSASEGSSSEDEDLEDFQDLDELDEDGNETIIPKRPTTSSSSSSRPAGTGSSRDGASPAPKVIKLTDRYSSLPKQTLSRADKKLLQSGRAATLVEMERKQDELNKLTAKQKAQGKQEDDENVENDLKLQRLLSESHILADQQQYSGADLTLQTLDYEEPTGKARKRTLDSRIRNIAAVNSGTGGLPKKLEKMPMSMRKGMISKYEQRVSKYEEDAKNAGIVLSKIKKGERRQINVGKGSTAITDRIGSGKKSAERVRDRGLKISSVGRSTRNGLVISKEEIERINGAGRRGGRGGKRGGRGGGRGGSRR